MEDERIYYKKLSLKKDLYFIVSVTNDSTSSRVLTQFFWFLLFHYISFLNIYPYFFSYSYFHTFNIQKYRYVSIFIDDIPITNVWSPDCAWSRQYGRSRKCVQAFMLGHANIDQHIFRRNHLYTGNWSLFLVSIVPTLHWTLFQWYGYTRKDTISVAFEQILLWLKANK